MRYRFLQFTYIALFLTILVGAVGFSQSCIAEEADESGTTTLSIWSTVNHYTWIYELGNTTPAEISFRINDKSDSNKIKKTLYKSTLHVIFSLDHGKNILKAKHGDEVLLDKEIHYYPSYESELVSENDELEIFHTAKNESSCGTAGCHRLTLLPDDSKPVDIKKQICYQCHSHKFENYTTLHKPAAVEWHCLLCHQAEPTESDLSPGDSQRFTIENPATIAPLCYKCHKKLKVFIESKKYMHGPIGMGGCTMCHSPHGSFAPKLLLKPANSLCIGCHELQEMLKKPFIHQVVKTKGCIACHNPHSSPYPMQLTEEITKLCYDCHPKIAKLKDNHPVHGHPVFIKEKPPSNRYTLTCIKCHSPHSSDHDKLLFEDEMMMICTKCHDIGSM